MSIRMLVEILNTALIEEERVSIVLVTSDPGVGVTHAIKQFAKSEDLSYIDIRTQAIHPTELMKILNKDDTVTDLGYYPIWNHLKSNDPVLVLIDEVTPSTLEMVEQMIQQIHNQAQAKVLVVLTSLKSEGGCPDVLMEKFLIKEAPPVDIAMAFIEMLRETKKSDVHLKVAGFIEENGLSGANPHQWELFASAKNMELDQAAGCGLGSHDLAKRFDAWSASQTQARS